MKTIAVVGAGAMGRGIIQWAAEAGSTVLAYDARGGAATDAVASISDLLSRAVIKGRITQATRDEIAARINIVSSLNDLSKIDMVVEAIVEDMDAKRRLFAELEAVVGDDTILCTNTSSLSVTACARDCRVPGRVAGLHFFNPVMLMKVVEVIRGERTRPDVLDAIAGFVARSAHRAVICDDTPGFVINHAGRGLTTEGLRLVQEGVATYADIDCVMRDYAGFPMGPFELFDLTGLDVSSRVLREIYEGFQHDPRYRPTPLVSRRVDAGLFGRKVGEGFYRYADGKKVEPLESPPPKASEARIFVDGCEVLSRLLSANGADLASDAQSADVTVMCPLGDDATTAALAAGYNPSKVVAIDCLFPERLAAGGRATLMATPVTDDAAVNTVHGALANSGLRVTRIADSPGFIAQRILANIVNTGCEIAQQRIATPADIDDGVKRGLGYPEGPLSLGDKIGPRRVMQILERLQATTGDPRYRQSLWLRRRAQLGLSLASR